jgi:WD40 repeat protein
MFRVAFSPDGRFEADSYEDGSVQLLRRDVARWIIENRMTVTPPTGAADGKVPLVAFSADSRMLISTMGRDKVRLHEMAPVGDSADAPPGLLAEFTPDLPPDLKAGITTVAVSRDGKFAAAATKAPERNARIFVWQTATRALLFGGPLESPGDEEINTLEFSPDTQRLASGGDAEFAVIWDLTKSTPQNPLRFPEEHTGKIRSVAYSPDGRMLATASGDNTLILWNAQTGSQIAPPLTGHQAPVVTAAFSPDGKLLASGGDDTLVMLWDIATKQAIGRLIGHTDTVRALAFSADSKRLFSGSWEEETRQWQLDPTTLQDICRERANRNLTKREWSAYFGQQPYHKTWPDLPDAVESEVASHLPAK